ncbi:MAG TPA: hypothetical protein VFL27_05005 [Candidatus Dormibacteraeota bacterium]|nr:hypothetical protein [Candidatus Dormibacteraeota bacterium]
MSLGRLGAGSMLLALPLVLAASPGPTPNLEPLGKILAGAPDAAWVEANPASDTLEGTFGATFYVDANWSDQATRDNVRSQLVADGFIGGYGRTFDRATPDGHIIEDVKAFPDAAHAMADWRWDLSTFHDATNPAMVVSTPAIPNSFGDRYLGGADSSWHGIDIYFTKANYVFTVTVGSTVDYLPDVAVAQSNAVYSFAPDHNVLPAPGSSVAATTSLTSALPVIAGLAAFFVIVVVVAVTVIIVNGNRRGTAPPSPYAALSPDGNYWWDGTQWQPVVRR